MGEHSPGISERAYAPLLMLAITIEHLCEHLFDCSKKIGWRQRGGLFLGLPVVGIAANPRRLRKHQLLYWCHYL